MNLDIDISLDHPKKDSKTSADSGSNLNKNVLDKYYNNNHMSQTKKSYSFDSTYSYSNVSSRKQSSSEKKILDELYDDYSVATYKKKIAAQKAFNQARENAKNISKNEYQYGNYSQDYSENEYSSNAYTNNFRYAKRQSQNQYVNNSYSQNNYAKRYSGNGFANDDAYYDGYSENYFGNEYSNNYSQENYTDNNYYENAYSSNYYSENLYKENYSDNDYSSNQNVAEVYNPYEYNNSIEQSYENNPEQNPVTVYYRRKRTDSEVTSENYSYDEDYFEINEKTAKELVKEEGNFSKYSKKIQNENSTPILDARSDMLNTAMIDISSHTNIETKRELKLRKKNVNTEDTSVQEDKPNYLEQVIGKCKERISRISEEDDDYPVRNAKGEVPGRNFESDLDDSIEAYRKRTKEKRIENKQRRREAQSEGNKERKHSRKKRVQNEYDFSDGYEISGIEIVLKIASAVVIVAIVMMLIKGIAPGEAVEAGNDTIETFELISANDVVQASSNEALTETPDNDTSTNSAVGPYGASNPAAYGFFEGYNAYEDESTGYIYDEEVASEYGVIIDLKDGRIVAQKNAKDKIYPASMTKVMTLLVAVENIENLEAKVTITQADTDYAYSKGLSAVNWNIGEVVTVRDLLYGTILPSGGDAAHALAVYIAGSEEEFAVMMNDKLKELGLSDTTHFTNCSGYYDDNHYSRMIDIAMILKAAESNEFCREVLDARRYKTSQTAEHPDGIDLSNLFLRRIEDKDTHGEVHGAKTGFVNESGCCAVSYAKSNDGNQYICVTGNAWSSWRCIYDHVQIYDDYTN